MKTILTVLLSLLMALCAFGQEIDLLIDLHPGSTSSIFQSHLTTVNGLLFFVADNGIHGQELFVMDEEENIELLDLIPGPDGSGPHTLRGTDTHVFFITSEYDGFGELVSESLWSSDGTIEGTLVLATFETFPDPAITHLINDVVATSSLAFFVAPYEGGPGSELWRSDGTVGGTYMIDINNDTAPSIDNYSENITPSVYNDQVYIHCSYLNGIFRSDGTPGGTQLVSDASHPYGSNFLIYEDMIYYVDGAGDLQTKSIAGGMPAPIFNANVTISKLLLVYKDKLYFLGDQPATGKELWNVDLSTGVASLLKDISAGPLDGVIKYLTPYKNQVYFSAYSGRLGEELWVSDGTPGGTHLFKNIHQGSGGSAPAGFTAYHGKLYFSANAHGLQDYGREVWATDGNPGHSINIVTGQQSGTYMVEDLYPGMEHSHPGNFRVYNDRLYFSARNDATGFEIFKLTAPSPGKKIVTNATMLHVFPNPTSGKVTLSVNKEKDSSDRPSALTQISQHGKMKVTDFEGQVVLRKTVHFPLSEEIDLGQQPKGIYIVKIEVGGQEMSRRVIVE